MTARLVISIQDAIRLVAWYLASAVALLAVAVAGIDFSNQVRDARSLWPLAGVVAGCVLLEGVRRAIGLRRLWAWLLPMGIVGCLVVAGLARAMIVTSAWESGTEVTAIIAIAFFVLVLVLLARAAGWGRIKSLGGEVDVQSHAPKNTISGDSKSAATANRQSIRGGRGENGVALSGSTTTANTQEIVP